VSTDPEPVTAPESTRRAALSSQCEPYREVIEEALGRGRNAVAIWQDLVDGHGFGAGYASVRRYVAKLRAQVAPEARVVITTAPGEEAQVDYGDGPMVRHLLPLHEGLAAGARRSSSGPMPLTIKVDTGVPSTRSVTCVAGGAHCAKQG